MAGLNKIAARMTVSIYLDSKVGRRAERIRCIYCGHPIIDMLNKIRSIVDNEGVDEDLQMGQSSSASVVSSTID